MNRIRVSFAAVVLGLVAVLAAGCGGSSEEAENPANTPYTPDIDPADFAASTTVDNPFFPLAPGTTFLYEGEEDGESVRVEDFVTHDTRQVLGVTCVVVRNREWVDGELAEETFDWYAQDNDGNVWYFGEASEEYDGGEVSTAGSWEAGVDGAKPGVIMLASPLAGMWYRQEFYEGEAEDVGEVLHMRGSATVPHGSFSGLLVTREWTPLEPGVVEHKYYAPGIGLVLEEAVKGGTARIELVDVTTE